MRLRAMHSELKARPLELKGPMMVKVAVSPGSHSARSSMCRDPANTVNSTDPASRVPVNNRGYCCYDSLLLILRNRGPKVHNLFQCPNRRHSKNLSLGVALMMLVLVYPHRAPAWKQGHRN